MRCFEEFKEYRIQGSRDKDQACRSDILERMLSLLEEYEERHGKVFIMRMDVRYPQNYFLNSKDRHMPQFIAHLTKNLSRKGLDPKYIWVREQSREKHQHYHVALILNGNLIQSPYKVFNKAEELWARALGLDSAKGLISYCNKWRTGKKGSCSYMLRRGAKDYEEIKRDAFYRLSYLAKENTKGNAPRRIREFGTSKRRQ
ncbi:YagK/YfjJ domain-containing protein [Desulfobaculum bizertense]|uniref:YagK/YfjJ C-terminal domain-containing protein n=1 Tax=Desulfobaculum bizertense DSM 18034 TaxID=1121442 RepID=A0A1T4VYD3_9BACT|nr:inovirus-type Gp2 protein [Desulfobaculum bizertense]SKA70006.1 Protein of unknown function [Desulfobaculum bizertense DSM 18034]